MLRFVPRCEAMEGGEIGDCPAWLSSLLRARGVDTAEKAERFLQPKLSMLYDPYLMEGMDRAVAILRQAAAEGIPVQVYGDYDCDGVTSTAIMLETLGEMGIRASARIPDRHREGYGLNEEAVREIRRAHGDGPLILLTVDCGITNHAEVRLAQSLGMTVIVTDHHQLAETPSPADVVLNPLCGQYPFRKLCGAGVALKLTQALLGMEAVERRVELAAIATIADIVPLADENRVIVAEGLRRLPKTARPGLKSLMAVSGLGEGQPVSAGQVAFRLAPRINAGGRLEQADQCVALLTGTDPGAAYTLAAHLEANNQKRQALQEEITRSAEAELLVHTDFYTDRALIVMGEEWNSGVIGLAAGRICEKYHYPTIVLSRSGEVAVGSCRSIPGVNIHAMLTRCSDLFMRFGGHEQAAGLTMRADLVPELRRRLNLYIDEACDPACYIPTAEYDLPLRLSEVDIGLIDRLSLLQPTGYANPAPVFLTAGAQVQQLQTVGKDQSHLRLSLLQGGTVCSGIAFRQAELAGSLGDRVDVLYAPEKNEFRGQVTAQLQIKALRNAAGSAPLPAADALMPGLIRYLAWLAAQPDAEAEAPAPITAAAWQRLCADGMGVLLVAHSRERAAEAMGRVLLDHAEGWITEPRPFNTVILNPEIERLPDSWHHIVLLDGALPGEAAALRRQCPRAELHAVKSSAALDGLVRALRPVAEVEALRGLYRALMQMARGPERSLAALSALAGLTAAQTETGLEILREVGYCEYSRSPWQVRLLPVSRPGPSPSDSRLYRYLRQAAEG